MAYKSKAIANAFLDLARERGQSVTPMKVQKLVYFAHGWHLATANAPLVAEPVEAWRWGPVFRQLYAALAEFGNQPITHSLREVIIDSGTPSGYRLRDYAVDISDDAGMFANDVVRRIWELYGHLSGTQLSKMTHEPGTPWDTVAREHEFQMPDRTIISDGLIRTYFRGLAGVAKV